MLRLTRAGHNWRITSASAGHPLPLLVDDRGTASAVGRAGTLVGVLDEVDLPEEQVTAEPGDLVVLYTDGVTEGRAPDGAFYGEQRLLAVLTATQRRAASEVAAALLADVLDYQQNTARDDIAIVALKVPSG